MLGDSAACGWLDPSPMNRIREIREAAGLSSDELAEMVGTTGATIRRLETGARELTWTWMQKISEALKVTPGDLIATAATAEIASEVEGVTSKDVPSSVAHAMAVRGMHVYKVLTRSVINAGIAPGDIITVDESEAGIAAVRGLDIVIAEIGPERTRVIRQYVPPGILIQNRGGSVIGLSLEDPLLSPVIVGVVLKTS